MGRPLQQELSLWGNELTARDEPHTVKGRAACCRTAFEGEMPC